MSAKGRPMGGVNDQRDRYSQIGGGQRRSQENVETLKRYEVEALEPQNVQVPKHRDIETLEPQNVETLKLQSEKTLKGQNATTSDEKIRQTVYLKPHIRRWIKRRIAETDQDISEVVNEALLRYMESEGA